ncbi:ETC complex I subunit conserved region-domain-containing protein [Yarrowia lipolytica]|uniref:YALI0E23089p n=2 Tax=Yarrowia lipolytica TaxID=4952 RepID=Q6C4W9_YARLI|nr:YALI0E23089p [Yarrowia lipolytica CLIB122]6GCS_F Chain F, NUFM SUBUNIT [Yarrowia lipolytica]6RFQ_F Chain F, Subunit NUFM of NADH:Ubiquinone Oxidoreductase (Complex I) [Yarrowia lipolytica]6RFR_F Chain F, Subunit NUFM of NADH:Ubiquinone Oxidoreductase (Complex I) [Yarrowia lipolytica]6RFS_F Chain F, Subunit NUFM of NADH:Ubiquinone Oxidoreductase (Complex I) [Yarrowia lipolytica]6Y79_F Chain F, Subunit NUFM of NADH:Ubiquinone Oxidoreductase (Complex I) [Yarrowia lipolytica]6YJ4_V Chain V, Su|eukprot:XP_504293.2 YALI0E23089p [Yarrowia lipolytica CLIB122]
MRYTQLLRNVSKGVQKSGQSVLVQMREGTPIGLTGIYQHPNPRPALIALYEATLKELQDKHPKDSVYRQSIENLTAHRKQIVEDNEVSEVIENKIGAGLIEEVVIQAHEELELAKKMSEWKPWEELEEKPLEDQWVYFNKKGVE